MSANGLCPDNTVVRKQCEQPPVCIPVMCDIDTVLFGLHF